MAANRPADSPLRRALHPPLVYAPIGGVVIAAVCDLASVVGGTSHDLAQTWFKAGSYALIVGTGGLFAAAAGGFVYRARHTVAGRCERGAVNPGDRDDAARVALFRRRRGPLAQAANLKNLPKRQRSTPTEDATGAGRRSRQATCGRRTWPRP
jgi:hypothetical protein